MLRIWIDGKCGRSRCSLVVGVLVSMVFNIHDIASWLAAFLFQIFFSGCKETLISIRTIKALAWERLSYDKLSQVQGSVGCHIVDRIFFIHPRRQHGPPNNIT